jgi:hypothetical protein
MPQRRKRKLGVKGLERRVASEYRRKGYSDARARAIGKAVAGNVATRKRRARRSR